MSRHDRYECHLGKAYPVVCSSDEIHTAVRFLAAQLNRQYADSKEEVIIIGVLFGSMVFLSDLIRMLNFNFRLCFARVSSYSGTQQVKTPEVGFLDVGPLKGKDVIIIDDILDTGETLAHLKDRIMVSCPNSLRTAVLFVKPWECRKVGVHVEYQGIAIPDDFVVGYGLDCDGKYRGLPCLVAYK